MNTVMPSFNIIMGQITERSWRKKTERGYMFQPEPVGV